MTTQMTKDIAGAQRLTDRTHWDGVHTAEEHQWTSSTVRRSESDRPVGLKAGLKRTLGPKFIASMSSYDDYVLWETVLPRYFEGRSNSKVVEIGSAPGDFLTRLKERFGMIPYGVEYSSSGAELNRRIFAAHGVDPANVIEADFFEMCTQERYRNAFDIVVSRGFIEHFRNVEDVVRSHLNLLRPGGLLLVAIPNLRGMNLALCSLFCPELIAIHNLEIMTPEKLAALFPEDLVQRLSCRYHGTFNFTLCYSRPDSPLRVLYAAGAKIQAMLNIIFRLLFNRRGVESAWFSPAIIFFGIKR
jgi:SAM-dependent methyltransferase